ncbi:DNA primase [Occultella glacieicola]|uniref:DNA primase n=1 Tax=Occultella glacieicola TaxID=2518684 RepID=A0ABY2E0Q5_9MICO|nr:DNA primase [Occultella glacieicola]TDE90358.1 DNA primase [Occultella glacieicola]
MATEPRAALDRLTAAFEAHLDAVASAGDDNSPAVIAATNTLADAFETYDEALYDAHGVDTPFVVYDGEDDEDEDFDDFDDEDEDEGDDELDGDDEE